MFLLPCLLAGVVFAILLGGRLARLAEVQIRLSSLVFLALGLQAVLFSRLTEGIDETLRAGLHIGSYGVLAVFALANLRVWALTPVLLGMFMNATAIVANGGRMPLSEVAARAVGLDGGTSNVSADADRLVFLGDVFALPSPLPLANVFSLGDIFIGFGITIFIVSVCLRDGGEAALQPRRLLQPLRMAPYRRLLAGKFVSQVGDWVTLAALVGWLYSDTGSTAHVAALLLLRLAPPILGGGIAVMLVDRLPKRALLIGVELARGGAVGAALVGVTLDATPLVYASLALSGALAALSAPAVPALVPSVVPDAQLPAANAGLGMTKDTAMAIGALCAGITLSTTGVVTALVIDLATFGVAAALFARVPRVERAASEEGEHGEHRAFGYVLRRRRLLILILSFATATLATGLTSATLPRFLDGDLGLGPSAYAFGMAALATGLLLGEALVGFSRVGQNAGRWIGCGLLVMAGLLGVLGMVEHAPTALLLLAAIGFVDGTTDVLFETTAQREADPRYYGAVFGFASTMMAVTMTGAFLAAPLLNNVVDATSVLIGAAGVLGAASAIALVGMRPSRTDVNQVSAAEGPSREDSAASVVALAPTQTAESSVAVTHADDATAGGRHERDVIIVASPSLITRAMELAWEVPSDLTVEIVMLMSGSSSLDGSPDARIVIMLLGADHEEVPAAITPHLKALAAR